MTGTKLITLNHMMMEMTDMEFSHTYILHEIYDEDSEHFSVWTLTSNEYTIRPATGFIDYDAIDKTHTWRIYTEKNRFGFFMAEIRRGDSQVFDVGFQVV